MRSNGAAGLTLAAIFLPFAAVENCLSGWCAAAILPTIKSGEGAVMDQENPSQAKRSSREKTNRDHHSFFPLLDRG
jgi:hypothetical protein